MLHDNDDGKTNSFRNYEGAAVLTGIAFDEAGEMICPSFNKGQDDEEELPGGSTTPAKMTAEQQAEAHWAYIRGVLEAHGTSADDIAICGHHYRTAFVHGWKHGVEDLQG